MNTSLIRVDSTLHLIFRKLPLVECCGIAEEEPPQYLKRISKSSSLFLPLTCERLDVLCILQLREMHRDWTQRQTGESSRLPLIHTAECTAKPQPALATANLKLLSEKLISSISYSLFPKTRVPNPYPWQISNISWGWEQHSLISNCSQEIRDVSKLLIVPAQGFQHSYTLYSS